MFKVASAARPEGAEAIASERYGRIAFVDGWRAIAVALVVGAHLSGALGVEPPARIGTLGVHIFFLISGFIITWLSLRELEKTGAFSQARFMGRRALRILPPLLAYLCVVLVVHWREPAERFAVVRAIFFTCNIDLPIGRCSWLTGHTWSLAFEEQFYLLFPFVLTRRFGPLFVVASIAYLMPLVMPYSFVGRIGHVQITGLFVLGMIYAKWRDHLDAIFRKLGVLTAVVPIAFLFWWLPMPPSRIQQLLGLFEPPALLLLIFGLPAAFRASQKVLGHFILARIGLYSYSIYLWQQLLLDKRHGWPWWGYVAGVAGTIAIAALSFRFYESRFQAISTRLFRAP